MRSEAQNLQAICAALDQHKESCEYPAIAVRMNPFEVERLGWDDVKGVPVIGDKEMQTGRFRVVCANESHHGSTSSRQPEKLAA